MQGWESRAREDLARAIEARTEGNEGMVRVCSRRAAGWAAKAYLQAKGMETIKASGFENILQLVEERLVGGETESAIERLTSNLESVNAEGEEVWPEDLDLIADAQSVIRALFPDFDQKPV